MANGIGSGSQWTYAEPFNAMTEPVASSSLVPVAPFQDSSISSIANPWVDVPGIGGFDDADVPPRERGFIQTLKDWLSNNIRLADQEELDPSINRWARGLGTSAGALGAMYLGLPPQVGYLAGSGINLAHRAIKGITGYGDYKVASN